MYELNELKLPKWAFLDIYDTDSKDYGRTLIEHIPTATIMEILDRAEDFALYDGVPTFKFKNDSHFGEERLLVAMYRPGTLEDISEIRETMRECAKWYCDYCDWEESHG
jgi:hypothetical protein